MTYNILEGGIGRIDPLAEVIRLSGADVVVVQEAWEDAAFHKLADRLGMDRFWAGNPRNQHGAVGLLSRWEIREAVNHAALDQRLTRGAFHAVVRRRSQPPPSQKEELGVIGVHLHAKKTMADEQVRLSELPAVFEIAREFAGGGVGVSHVLAGDFNASHPGQRVNIGWELPREVVRKVLERGYVDAHALHHAEEAFDVSFPTSKPVVRVDYVFVTPELAPRVKGCEVFKPEMGRFASDHFPVVAELEL